MTSFVVLSDLHANATALRAALAEARKLAPDRVVVLGDLLTYGFDVQETLEIVASLAREGAPVLLGNHDKLYLDLDRHDTTYFDSLPVWLRECVEHTRALLGESLRARDFELQYEVLVGPCLFSHANPFGVPDWTYLNDAPEILRAASTLATRGVRVGIFGHTHRRRIHRVRDGALETCEGTFVSEADDGLHYVVNAGSVGQPRGDDGRPSFLHLEIDETVRGRLVPFDYDASEHLERIRSSPLTHATRARLLRYFTP